MGKVNANANDTARFAQSVSVTSAITFQFGGPVQGTFNVSITGTFVATVQLEESFDGGANWAPVSGPTLGTTATFTAPTVFIREQVEPGVLYRVNCTAWTSGTAVVRLSA